MDFLQCKEKGKFLGVCHELLECIMRNIIIPSQKRKEKKKRNIIRLILWDTWGLLYNSRSLCGLVTITSKDLPPQKKMFNPFVV